MKFQKTILLLRIHSKEVTSSELWVAPATPRSDTGTRAVLGPKSQVPILLILVIWQESG